MRVIVARFAGKCAGCQAGFPKGTTVGYLRRRTYCGECVGQYRRDVAADDLDMMTMGY